jgi:Putative metallopeptidase
MNARILPVLAVGLLLAACGGGGAEEKAESSSGSATSATPNAKGPDETGGADASGGKMIVTYDDATSPDAQNGKKLLQDNKALEDLAADINQSLKLPIDIPLHGSQCNQPNAFWDPNKKSVTICYEDADLSQKIFVRAGDQDPDASAIGAEDATFYHEAGHMAIALYNLPITGKEEDAADQLAAYILLTPADNGKVDAESVQAVKDFARTFAAYAELKAQMGRAVNMADVHSLDQQRVYNLQCWIYGSNPDANADIVSGGGLPQDRAKRCPDEWKQISHAWSTLLDEHWK